MSIALIGDRSPDVVAHRAIPLALERVAVELDRRVESTWLHSTELRATGARLEDCDGFWIVPGSPYADAEAVIRVIRWARERRRPILGTCGGFQHMLIECARNLSGLTEAEHAETAPEASVRVIERLACGLVEHTGAVHFAADSVIGRCYGSAAAVEGYRCRFGLNAAYRSRLEQAGLRFTAFDDDGEVRGAELPGAVHPFFCGTLFQPERAVFRGETPPLARALIAAAADFGGAGQRT